MKVTYDYSTVLSKPSAVAIGIFDGVHRGHQYLIKRMLAKAKQLRLMPTVVTFFPHPMHVLKPQGQLPYLSSLQDRLVMMKSLGVKHVVVIKFDQDFANIKPEYFVQEVLYRRLKAKAVFVGEDFRFGYNRLGNIFLLERFAAEMGFYFQAVNPLKDKNVPISSTRIRGLVTEGDLSSAKRLLGRAFSVSGKVIRGDGRGRLLGFPTANVFRESDVVPPKGVYAVLCVVARKTYLAVANLGIRPTFVDASEGLHLEVHVIGRHVNLYDKRITVVFIKRIRDERTFESKEALTQQIMKDIVDAKRCVRLK